MITFYLEVAELLNTGKIYGINGPVIYLKGNTGFRMQEMVYVGEEKLVGEVIALDKDMTTIQVYEETTGLRPGEEVIAQENNYQGMPYVRRQTVLLRSDQRSFRCPDRWKCLWQGRRFGPEGSCFLP